MRNIFLIIVTYTTKMRLFHVGVYQLTIERFSGANDMRAHKDERNDGTENINQNV